MRQIISYLRVSIARQGESRLGIKAQQQAVVCFAAAQGMELPCEYVELATGRGQNALEQRPQLSATLATARKAKAAVVAEKKVRKENAAVYAADLRAVINQVTDGRALGYRAIAGVFTARGVGAARKSFGTQLACASSSRGNCDSIPP
jgi:DNA invertase Pin-like site-specific DNA recombinase